MNKRGQFYIIAAVIIISVVIGFIAYRNYSTNVEANSKVYDLGEELKIETGSVFDYGVYNQKDTNNLVENWTERYYEYSRLQGIIEDWVFIYGDANNATVLRFTTESSGSIGIITSGGTTGVETTITGKGRENIIANNGKVSIVKDRINYDFQLKPGQNFYFVMKGGQSSVS